MSFDATSDQLLDRSLAGDKLATEQLLLIHYDWLRRHLQRQIPSDLQGLINAEDILQETFIRVFRSIQRFKPLSDASFPHWLKTIAEHQLVDLMKRRQRERLAGVPQRTGASAAEGGQADSLVEEITDGDLPPFRKAILGELRQLVPVALAALPDDHREALHLRYLEGLPLEEVATAMNRSPDAVRGLCHRARKQLREVLVRLSSYM